MHFEIGFLWIGLISIFGHFCEGCAGFGCTVVAAPVVNTILPPSIGVPFGTLMAVPFLLIQTIINIIHKQISYKDLGKILLVCLPGLFLGQFLFTLMDPRIGRLGIGTTVTVVALMKCYQNFIKPMINKEYDANAVHDTKGGTFLRWFCLILGGIAQGAFNMGGPLITVYTLEAVKDKTLYRNTMLCFFAITDTLNAISHFRNGAWTLDLASVLVIALPLAAIGFFIGVKATDKINRATFMKLVSVLLLVIGGTQLTNAIKAFL